MSLTIEVAGKSDMGCVRTNNEDNFGFDARYGIFIVCDGMGGAAAGEVASKMSVDTVLTYFREASKNGNFPSVGHTFEGVSERANALASAIQLANAAVYEMGSKHAAQRGLITKEQAEKSEMANIIIKALGSEESVKPDVDDLIALPGDILLLASDGLTKHVKDDWMLGIVNEAPSLDQACNDLIDAAKAHGGDDNITCILLKMVDRPWYENLFSKFFPGGSKWQNS